MFRRLLTLLAAFRRRPSRGTIRRERCARCGWRSELRPVRRIRRGPRRRRGRCGIERHWRLYTDGRRRARAVVQPQQSRLSGLRMHARSRGIYPGSTVDILCLELACSIGHSDGRTVQALRHRLDIGQQLIGMRFELLGERQAQIVVAPTTLGLRQAIPQSRIGLPHPVTEFGQPCSPLSQTGQVQPCFTVHVPPRSVRLGRWCAGGTAARNR